MTRTAALSLLFAWALGLAIGILGYAKFSPDPKARVEVISHMPEVVQNDGSLVLEVLPNLSSTPPPHKIPKGFKEERRVTATIKPDACAPVDIAVSIVDDGERRRAIVSATGGEILSATDIPISSTLIPSQSHPKKWALGVSYSTRKDPGLWMERDIGRVRLGVDLIADGATVRAGWNF